MPRAKAPCGTEAAYRRHKRSNEPIDEACREAHEDAKYARTQQERAERHGQDEEVQREARSEASPLRKTHQQTIDKHLEYLEETRDNLALAIDEQMSSDSSKLAPLTREYRATLAEIERLTADREAQQQSQPERSALGAFLDDNVVGFPGAAAS